MADPARAPTRAAHRQARTRVELIRAAGEIIAERGLERLRISDITERANVAFGTFYNQFKAKDDVVEAVVGEALTGVARSIEDSPAYADPAAAVVATTTAIVRIAYDDPTLARLLVNLEQAESRFERIIRPQASAVLERGVAEGVFDISDLATVLTMSIAAAFEVIRGIVDGRLPEGAELTCAEGLLRLAGMETTVAARYIAAARPQSAPSESSDVGAAIDALPSNDGSQ